MTQAVMYKCVFELLKPPGHKERFIIKQTKYLSLKNIMFNFWTIKIFLHASANKSNMHVFFRYSAIASVAEINVITR